MSHSTAIVGLTAVVLGQMVLRAVVLPRVASSTRRFLNEKAQRDFAAFKKELGLAEVAAIKSYQDRNVECLLRILSANASTEIGQENDFSSCGSVESFQKLPLTTYYDVSARIDRMCAGETALLTNSKLLYFATSSGTTGKQKMIPITKSSWEGLMAVVNMAQGAGDVALGLLMQT
jgi:hypothetical protein